MSYLTLKRGVDIFGAVIGLLFILPFYPLIALAIKLETKGPAIIKLARVSSGKIIYVYKFRTMQNNTHELKPQLLHLNERRDGTFFKIKNDPRLTHVGKILRKFRIDEFPQLINVLKGELSLVGPRPHEAGEMFGYPLPYRHLLIAKAGLTGLSQVNGASSLPFLKELELDNQYLRTQSLWQDLKILAKTLWIFLVDPTGI